MSNVMLIVSATVRDLFKQASSFLRFYFRQDLQDVSGLPDELRKIPGKHAIHIA